MPEIRFASPGARARGVAALIALGCCSCGAASEAEVPAVSVAPTTAAVPPGSVKREQVVATVEAGLGTFLQRVQVEPVFEAERFVGFQLISIQPADAWLEYGLRVGDVVTHVNSRSVQQETDAYEVFQALRSAPEIRVLTQRSGERREVVIPIVGAPAPVAPAPSTAAGAEPPPPDAPL